MPFLLLLAYFYTNFTYFLVIDIKYTIQCIKLLRLKF